MKQSKFTKEFKLETIKLVTEQGLSVTKAAEDVGVGKSTLAKWVQDFNERKIDLNRPNENELEELRRLRKENHVLKIERDLLKKTAVYFAKASQSGAN